MKISYNRLQTYFSDKLPTPEKLAEVFTFHFAEVESVEKVGDDTVLDVKVLPDRASYAKSVEGIARETRAILDLPIRAGTIPKDPASSTKTFSVRISHINDVLGTDLSNAEIIAILARMYISVKQDGKKGEDLLTLSVPEDRLDLRDWRDIPEEIGRIYGYDKIKSALPKKVSSASSMSSAEKTFYYSEKIKNILSDLSFSEIYGYSLVSKGDYEIEKSVASDKNFLRINLTEGVVKSLELNAKNADLLGLETIQVFEIGKVFPEGGEHTSLCIGIKNIKKKQDKENEKIKKVRDELMKALGADADIKMKNNTEGILELDLDTLIAALPEVKSYNDLSFGKAAQIEYKKFSLYPFIVRDVAVFISDAVSADQVWTIIQKGISDASGTDLLARHSLFDTFKKDGKTSYAFRMIFQAVDRTLTDAETNNIMERVHAALKVNGWEVR